MNDTMQPGIMDLSACVEHCISVAKSPTCQMSHGLRLIAVGYIIH